MISATIYIEDPNTGKIEKIAKSFDSARDRANWIADQIRKANFTYLICGADTKQN